MRVDLSDSDGVIAATCNIPDSLWTSTVQAAANAAAASRGFTVDASDPDDTIDPHVQTISDQTSLTNWILANAYTAGATAPASSTAAPAAAAPDDAAAGATIAILAVAAVGALAWLVSSGGLSALEPPARSAPGERARARRITYEGQKRWRVTDRGETVGEVVKLRDGSWQIVPSSRSPLDRRASTELLSDAATDLHRRGS